MNSDHNPDELVTLIAVQTEPEAAPIVEALAAAGIGATMTGGFTASFMAEAPGHVSIKIFERDRVAAEKVLAQFKIENENIDWSKVDVGQRKET